MRQHSRFRARPRGLTYDRTPPTAAGGPARTKKQTAVKDYASGEELIAEIRKRAELFIAEFDDVVGLVASLSRDELFTSGQRAWASSTPSAWPVAKWVHINTVAPFTSFRTRIRAWKRR